MMEQNTEHIQKRMVQSIKELNMLILVWPRPLLC